MSRRPLTLLLSTLLFIATPLLARADAPSDLLNLHQMRLAAQRSISDFFLLTSTEGDARYAGLVDSSTADASNAADRLGAMPGGASTQLKSQLDQQWLAYRQNLTQQIQAQKQNGYNDFKALGDLAEQNRQLLDTAEQLYGKIQEESGVQVPPLTQQSREQSLLMQAITWNYVARNISVGANPVKSEDQQSLDDLSNRFAINLLRLQQAPQTSPEIGRELRAISTKWHFIEKSLQSAAQSNLPILIDKYSDGIIADLEQVSGLYAAAQQ
ncbi:hypothetical protein [Pseudomonas knackmussii]|uniref:hypothetical protein n=1 Tax=Pseudomonas knackmussii TaxID=65741 RepID=UPI003F4A3ABC